MSTKLKVLSYNIHRGFSSFNASFVLEEIRKSIRSTGADFLCLQEVSGHLQHGKKEKKNVPSISQFEFLAEEVWPFFSYGKNAVYQRGHHGNAILSKYPIIKWENLDISTNRFERRGLLHAEIDVPGLKHSLHLFCTHLNLLEASRQKQILTLCERIQTSVPKNAPVILAGDFNDWRENLSTILKKEVGIEETYLSLKGKHPSTYPSWLPKFRIDRVYHGNLKPKEAHYFKEKIWRRLSDHLPIMVELEAKTQH